MERFVCVHGHFYQPPRENPWLDAVEIQDEAHPYHDWNARITAECYGPNANSRILDSEGFVRSIVNNYARISFNFGPTLLDWFEREAPDVYASILEADRQSRQRFSGHGSAMAQAFNHLIMPLANERDKHTQVAWGIRDFERRFGRRPEGMWLPETAVDLASLEALAAQGIGFTVLAPHQVRRVRALSGGEWRTVDENSIDTSRAYIVRLPSGRQISVFFYDKGLAHAVAFERVLASGEEFAARLVASAGSGDEAAVARLGHIATDGETYGHHHRFGDMALAYALEHIETQKTARLTNYGEFLALHPPAYEVEIAENTSWSCPHGVERWRANCGCKTGRHPSWEQTWRKPLRDTLDWLRDELVTRYETGAKGLLSDSWLARDEYIDVVLDRSAANVASFLSRHAPDATTAGSRTRALQLLEMQRQALLMFSSCAWFFEDIGGIETVQVLMHAGRAIQLAEQLSGAGLEAQFERRMAPAKSNLPERGDGTAVYRRNIEMTRVDLERVAGHYAVSALFEDYDVETDTGLYSAKRLDGRVLEDGRSRLALGEIEIASAVTLESARFAYAALHVGDQNVVGGVEALRGATDTKRRDPIIEAFSTGDLARASELINDEFEGASLSLRSLFKDEQRAIIGRLLEPVLDESEETYRQLYEEHIPMIRFLTAVDYPIPNRLRTATEFALNLSMRHTLAAEHIDDARVRSSLEDAKLAGVELDKDALTVVMQTKLEALVEAFQARPDDIEAAEALLRCVELLPELALEVDLWRTQEVFYLTARELLSSGRAVAPEREAVLRALGKALRVRLG